MLRWRVGADSSPLLSASQTFPPLGESSLIGPCRITYMVQRSDQGIAPYAGGALKDQTFGRPMVVPTGTGAGSGYTPPLR